jgi:hypothetical protein
MNIKDEFLLLEYKFNTSIIVLLASSFQSDIRSTVAAEDEDGGNLSNNIKLE